MRDEQLLRLVQMATEAREWDDQLSLSGEAPSHAPRGQGLGILLGLAACVALAACLTLVVWLDPGSPTGSGPGSVPRPRASADAAPGPVRVQSDSSMVLALFRDPESQCECFVWREASFGERNMSDVRPSELLAAALKDACSSQRQGTVFVVGLQGPREQLPPTREAARALASCMAGGTETCGEEASCYGAGAVGCVPSGVRVVAEAIRH
ncbi:MAG: hypothetical protein DYG92_03295 [Leptolyngbya sp. PLA1]|nr:hypothetical protein [Leptolyngbya sp. PLA1]